MRAPSVMLTVTKRPMMCVHASFCFTAQHLGKWPVMHVPLRPLSAVRNTPLLPMHQPDRRPQLVTQLHP